MKQTLTPTGLPVGFSSTATPVTRITRLTGLFIALLLLSPSGATAQALIETFISGPTEVCQDQSVTYGLMTEACNNVFWKVTYNDTRIVLDYASVKCASGESAYAYTTYDLDAIQLGTQLFAGKCGGFDFSGSTSSLPIKFKLKGKYKIETEPAGPKLSGYPSLCQKGSKTLYVGMQPVASSITGFFSIPCDRTSPVSYSIPPVPGAREYVWSLPNSGTLGLHSPQPSNGGATVTFQVNAASGATSGFPLSVTVYSKCAGEAPVTRSVTLARANETATIFKPLPPLVCRGGTYTVQGAKGNNMRWTFSYYGSTGATIVTQNYTGSFIYVTVPTDTRINNVGYILSYTNVCSGQAG